MPGGGDPSRIWSMPRIRFGGFWLQSRVRRIMKTTRRRSKRETGRSARAVLRTLQWRKRNDLEGDLVTDHPASRTSERPQPFSRTMRPSSPTTGTTRERSRLGSGTKTGSTWCAIPKWAEPLPKFLAGLTTRHQHICKTWRYRAGCGTGAHGPTAWLGIKDSNRRIRPRAT
jgi:hypothetical protein